MKVYELFESKKQEGRRDKAVLKKDYLRWKKLVNMPIRFIQASAESEYSDFCATHLGIK